MMKSTLVLVGLAFAFFTKPVWTGIHPNLKFVATVDGKSFFADNATTRDWSSSKLFCESIGMKLASVTSQAQWDALDNAYGTGDFVHAHWTSATDSLKLSQFNWDSTSDISATYAKYNPWSDVPMYCLLISKTS